MSYLISLNPATGEPVGEVPTTPLEAIPAMVCAARDAQVEWSHLSVEERGHCLLQAARALEDEAPELGELLSQEMGKPLRKGIGEVRFCAASIAPRVKQALAALQPRLSADEDTASTVYYDPLGVCAVISPWNYPMSMPQWMLLPALLCGNTVLFKPSEETPLTGQAYAELLNRFLPRNVLQVVQGAEQQGRSLVEADINMVAFTGSREAGRDIMARSAPGLKRLMLELGGKDPLLVLDDADLDAAAEFACASSFENSGQACVSTERVYVDRQVATCFEQRVVRLADGYSLGPWHDARARLGPMIHERQRQHVLDQIAAALAAGARRLYGDDDHPPRYIKPTILADCTPDMAIMRDETFGPVMCIQAFDGIDEALRLANDTDYGLGAVVFGEDEEQAWQVARHLGAGMIGVNKSCFGTVECPWVGARQSGYGYHGSVEGFHQFCQLRVISKSKDS
ncbi:NAD-dependent succinate-semialdehyde dehydrogenase [Marinobacterium nitratireducens]|uniref:NAD-dependent succinate-semialdehyde dehydrogenase n=1 Tax=Marinobacterium nitratireducens TaxID=518897 RepID=A0A917ZDY2_9GAMM|nr:aldehyde dehydrogenase [Marinobacterium nitratireducens]GGO81235.1 NAD-dependent succinate-semialdehyde dehydrogenase [Marinobacterium nitratireducens]